MLVDATFLLPALGVEVEEEVMRAIGLFRKLEVYYLEVGILEAMWKILKVVPPEKLERTLAPRDRKDAKMSEFSLRTTVYRCYQSSAPCSLLGFQ